MRVPPTALRAAKAPDDMMNRALLGLRLRIVLMKLALLMPEMNWNARL